jgi:carbon-monoxide dehydrogenase medium subunit
MTRQRNIEFSDDVKAASPIVLEALSHVGHRQTRNRGTIGGSLCHLDPSAELVNMALLHDAEMDAASKRGRRKMKASEFVAGYMTTALAPDEILVGVSFNRWPKGHGYAFEEFARRHGDFAICAVGVLVTLAGGKIARAALTISGVGQTPSRAGAVEALLAGQAPSKDLYRAAAAEAHKTEAISDAYVSADYRKHLARILTYRAVERAVERAGALAS